MLERSKIYKPFKYQWAEDYRQESEQMHWVTDEVDFSQDLVDFKENLSEDEREFVKSILSIFTQSDLAVGNYYIDFLLPRIQNNEIRGMLSSFNNREWEHQRGYAQLNESLGLPESYYTDFLKHPETLGKWEFYKECPEYDLILGIAKQILTEGIGLFGAFIMLKNFERFGLLMGTCKINEWSLKDETLHVEGNTKLFNLMQSTDSLTSANVQIIKNMADTIVRLEMDFIDFAFDKHTIRGLDKEDVKNYIRYICNRRLTQMYIEPIYPDIYNPLPWFDEITNGSSLQNFFEGRSADYDISGLTGEYYMTEQQIQKKITTYLESLDNTYVVKVVKATKAGVPDILCCIGGIFLAIEVKRPEAKNTVSKLQAYNISKIERTGGHAIVAWDVEYVKDYIESEGLLC